MASHVTEKDASNAVPGHKAWWKSGTVYQVWPASYKDSNGDGLGDIPGIIDTLDYLKDLGVDIIWLSPMYASPQKDMGYDISDYEDIYPPYGTLADMDRLIAEMKKRDMKLLLDLVINHSSDLHVWFQESKSSRTNPKADWYHWKDAKYIDGERHPPNNWRATFGGSAWDYVPERDQYYLHTFETEQPDLNWENPHCRSAIYSSAITFWLKRGVAGFRMDVVNFYSKNMNYPDAPITDPSQPYQRGSQFYMNGPKMHQWLKELRRDVLDPFGDIMTVGECPGTGFDESLEYVSAARRELKMIFDFDIVMTGGTLRKPWHEIYRAPLSELKAALLKVQKFSAGTDAWATVFGENHDFGRSVTRFGTNDPRYWARSAKVLAMLFASLTGTLFIYQGQEIGMTNIPESWGPEELQDVAALKYWNDMNSRHPEDKELLRKALKGLQWGGRDNVRTPVQWDDSEYAGFSKAKPWMRVNENKDRINVAAQIGDEDSVFGFWKRVLKVRKEYEDHLIYGGFEMLDVGNDKTFTFLKEDEVTKSCILVALNFGESEEPVFVPERLRGKTRRLLTSNVADEGEHLSAWEGRIYLME